MASDDGFVAVAQLDELIEGEPKGYRVEGREIILSLWRGDVFATRSVCPHQQASLVGGIVRARLVSGETFGEVSLDHGGVEVLCPWHAWAFDLRTGICRADSTLRIRSYDVRIEDGTVLVGFDSHRSNDRKKPKTTAKEVSV